MNALKPHYLMKKFLLFLALPALFSCQKQVYVTTRTGDVRFHHIITQEMVRALNIPVYTAGMKPGSSFLITALPGIPLDTGDFSLLAKGSFIESPEVLDKAYLFARLVNVVIPNTQFSSAPPAFLGNGSFVARAISEGLIEDAMVIGCLYPLSNPHYDDQFYFTAVNPNPQLPEWTQVLAERHQKGTVTYRSRTLHYTQPSYDCSADIKLLNIYRPWLQFTRSAFDTSLSPANTFAIITQLIISKNMVIRDYQGSSLRISARGSVAAPIVPAASLKTDSPVIVGFVCLII
jgi:hypothetical protein